MRKTLLACSGGADSSALVLMLSAVTRHLVVAHVVHDLREPGVREGDRDAARDLARQMDLPFVHGQVEVRRAGGGGGNVEARARRARYALLGELAREHGCPYVATAHHADDQLETMLMRLIRGSGPRGLAGIAEHRALVGGAGDEVPGQEWNACGGGGGGGGVTLIRPMLDLSRADSEAICRMAGWSWRHDHTNDDRARLRARIRHDVMPVLRSIRADASHRSTGSARLMGEAARIVDERARFLDEAAGEPVNGAARGAGSGPDLAWRRESLESEPGIVVGTLLRQAASKLGRGCGRDRLGLRAVDPLVCAICGGSPEPREFCWKGCVIRVDRRWVTMTRKDAQ